MKRKTSLWVLGLCLAAPASAAAQTVYFSSGKEIRAVNATGGSTTLVHTSTISVGDLALCAGNPADTADATTRYLYFVERSGGAGDRISRLNTNVPLARRASVNGSAEPVFALSASDGTVGEIRLTTDCDVLFATSRGVFRVAGSPPFSTDATAVANAGGADIATAAGSGLAVAFDGSLRYSDGAALKSSHSNFPATTAAAPIVGVGIANAGHGSATAALLPPAPPPPAAPQLPVGPACVSTSNTIVCGPKAGGTLATTFATFSVPNSTAVNNAQFFEFLTNDTAIVATSVDPNVGLGGSAKFNGILWRVTAGGVSELARGAKTNGVFVPIVGVAVGPSTASVTTAVANTHYVNFGPVAFDAVTPVACGLTITLRQLTWSEARAKIDPLNAGLPSTKYLLDPGLGGESWVDDVDVTPNGNCGLSVSSPALVGIAQYNDNTPSRAVLHCHANACAVVTHGNYPYSTPDDERDSALPDNFSDFLTATIQSTGAAIVFSSPLSNAAVVNGAIDASEIAAATSHNASGGLSLRFRICANDACTLYAPAEQPNPPVTGAGLSVTRLTNNGVAMVDCFVSDQGSSTPDLPVFRTTDPDGVTHNFNLNTPLDGPGPCQLSDLQNGQSGLFVATVFSHGGRFSKTSVLFRLTK